MWLQELQTFHKLSADRSVEISKLEVNVAQMKDKLRSYEKTESLLGKSLKQISRTAESLQMPIRFEMELISCLERLDLEI